MTDIEADVTDVDVAVVGAGGAGLSLVRAIAASGSRPSVALIDPATRRGPDRTWCFWDEGSSELDPLLHRTWSELELVDARGAARRLDVSPMRYVMLRSEDFYADADRAAEALGALRIQVAAEVEDGPERATVRAGDRTLRARWVFDSRPAAPARPGRTMLLQHFRGWIVRLPGEPLDPLLPTLMDFSVPQPARGVAFVYCLPLDRSRALVEYTEFSRERLPSAAYDEALAAYLRRRWAAEPEIEHVEDGVIPMTDAVFARRAGRRVFRLGTAGGATRPSTGYTFSAMQRQAAAVAAALARGAEPLPPPAYPARHRWMDAVLLRAIDRGVVAGSDLFVRLFERNPPQRVLRFLDGDTAPPDELALMATAPQLRMIRAGAGDAAARLVARVHGMR